MENSTDGGIIGAEHFVRLPVNASHQYYPGGVASHSNSRNLVAISFGTLPAPIECHLNAPMII